MNARTITLKELAEELGYDNTTISYAVKKGYLPKPEIKILTPGKGRSSYAWKEKISRLLIGIRRDTSRL